MENLKNTSNIESHFQTTIQYPDGEKANFDWIKEGFVVQKTFVTEDQREISGYVINPELLEPDGSASKKLIELLFEEVNYRVGYVPINMMAKMMDDLVPNLNMDDETLRLRTATLRPGPKIPQHYHNYLASWTYDPIIELYLWQKTFETNSIEFTQLQFKENLSYILEYENSAVAGYVGKIARILATTNDYIASRFILFYDFTRSKTTIQKVISKLNERDRNYRLFYQNNDIFLEYANSTYDLKAEDDQENLLSTIEKRFEGSESYIELTERPRKPTTSTRHRDAMRIVIDPLIKLYSTLNRTHSSNPHKEHIFKGSQMLLNHMISDPNLLVTNVIPFLTFQINKFMVERRSSIDNIVGEFTNWFTENVDKQAIATISTLFPPMLIGPYFGFEKNLEIHNAMLKLLTGKRTRKISSTEEQ